MNTAKQQARRTEAAWLAAVLALAALLRLHRLGTYAFWQDEIHNLIKAEHLGDVLLHGSFVSNHPPLYPILLRGWMELGLTHSEWLTRFVPVTLGVFGIAAAYFLVKRLFDGPGALATAFLMAIAPFHIHHSQELKVYILLPCVGTLAVLALYESFARNTWRWWAAYAFLAALSCYSELFAGPLLVAVNLWAMARLVKAPDRLRGWLVANIVGALLFLPQLKIMIDAAKEILIDATMWWVPGPSLLGFAFYVKTLAYGYSDLDPWFKIALVLYCLAVVGGLAAAAKRGPWQAALLACWFAIPIALVWAVSLYTQSIFLIRSMIPYAIPFYALAGVGVAALPGRCWRGLVLAGAAVLMAAPIAQQYRGEYPLHEFPHRPGVHPPQRFDEAAAYLLDNWQEGDIVIHPSYDPSFVPLYWYGLRQKKEVQFRGDVSEQFIDIFYAGNPINATDDVFDDYYVKQLQPILEGRPSFWFVFNEWEREQLPGFAFNTWRWVDAHYRQVGYQDFGGFEIFRYEDTPVHAGATARKRDKDNGVSREMTYGEGRYLHRDPDMGLAPTPIEARRGALRLYFAEAPTAAPHPLAEGEGPYRDVAFAVENRGGETVACRIECVSSDYLVEFANFREEDPDSRVWSVGGMYNPTAPPDRFGLPCAEANAMESGDASVSVFLECGRGHYRARLYCLGIPGDTGSARAPLRLGLGAERLLFELNSQGAASALLWNWLDCGTLVLPEPEPRGLRLEAIRPAGVQAAWANAAYLALTKSSEKPGGASGFGKPIAVWPGQVHIAPGAAEHFTARIPRRIGRVDIWAYAYRDGGCGYRIFERFDE